MIDDRPDYGITFYSPFCTMLARGMLQLQSGLHAKTKPAGFNWNYRGRVYLRHSLKIPPDGYTRKVAERHSLDFEAIPRGHIVGYGNLVEVRPLTIEEEYQLTYRYNEVQSLEEVNREPFCVPNPVGLFFDSVTELSRTVPYNSGAAVNQFRFNAELVIGQPA